MPTAATSTRVDAYDASRSTRIALMSRSTAMARLRKPAATNWLIRDTSVTATALRQDLPATFTSCAAHASATSRFASPAPMLAQPPRITASR